MAPSIFHHSSSLTVATVLLSVESFFNPCLILAIIPLQKLFLALLSLHCPPTVTPSLTAQLLFVLGAVSYHLLAQVSFAAFIGKLLWPQEGHEPARWWALQLGAVAKAQLLYIPVFYLVSIPFWLFVGDGGEPFFSHPTLHALVLAAFFPFLPFYHEARTGGCIDRDIFTVVVPTAVLGSAVVLYDYWRRVTAIAQEESAVGTNAEHADGNEPLLPPA